MTVILTDSKAEKSGFVLIRYAASYIVKLHSTESVGSFKYYFAVCLLIIYYN